MLGLEMNINIILTLCGVLKLHRLLFFLDAIASPGVFG